MKLTILIQSLIPQLITPTMQSLNYQSNKQPLTGNDQTNTHTVDLAHHHLTFHALSVRVKLRNIYGIFKKRVELCFKKLQIWTPSNNLSLRLLQGTQQRLLANAFFDIRNMALKKVKISNERLQQQKLRINRILYYRLLQCAKAIKRQAIQRIRHRAELPAKLQKFSSTIKSLDKQRQILLFNGIFNKIRLRSDRVQITKKAYKSLSMIFLRLCHAVQLQAFRQITRGAHVEDNLKCKHTINYQLRSEGYERSDMLRQARESLIYTKQEIQMQMKFKNQSKAILTASLENSRKQLKELSKNKGKTIKELNRDLLSKESYMSELEQILQKRRHYQSMAQAMEKQVLTLYTEIYEKQQLTRKQYLVGSAAIQNQDVYHLYCNQKLRQTLLLYNRGSSIFQKQPQEEKVINENQALKAYITDIITRRYQIKQIRTFLNKIQL